MASPAYRITLSPHEWEWTQEDQEEMAREIIKYQKNMEMVTAFLHELRKSDLRHEFVKLAAEKLLHILNT